MRWGYAKVSTRGEGEGEGTAGGVGRFAPLPLSGEGLGVRVEGGACVGVGLVMLRQAEASLGGPSSEETAPLLPSPSGRGVEDEG